nr:hypothetical protein Itr_chr09CG05350 [Ipomoea trifida]
MSAAAHSPHITEENFRALLLPARDNPHSAHSLAGVSVAGKSFRSGFSGSNGRVITVSLSKLDTDEPPDSVFPLDSFSFSSSITGAVFLFLQGLLLGFTPDAVFFPVDSISLTYLRFLRAAVVRTSLFSATLDAPETDPSAAGLGAIGRNLNIILPTFDVSYAAPPVYLAIQHPPRPSIFLDEHIHSLFHLHRKK